MGVPYHVTDTIHHTSCPTHPSKINAILCIAEMHNHRVLVLSAFGCGAFRNPPYHIACLFRQVEYLQLIVAANDTPMTEAKIASNNCI